MKAKQLLQSFLKLDFAASVGAGGWALGAQYVEAMDNLVSWEMASAFAIAALTRWYLRERKAK